jgi:hypothetical protein
MRLARRKSVTVVGGQFFSYHAGIRWHPLCRASEHVSPEPSVTVFVVILAKAVNAVHKAAAVSR